MEKSEFANLLKEIRKSEKDFSKEKNVKIAVLGSFSIQYFVKILKFYLSKSGINADIYEGEYDGINMDVFDSNSSFYRFKPDYVIILPYYEDIKFFPTLLSDEEEVNDCIETTISYYNKVWTSIHILKNCKILQANIVIPPIRSIGNIENEITSSNNFFLKTVNEQMIVKKPSYVTIVDVETLASNIGKYQWFDYPSYFWNKTGVRLEYMPELVQAFIHQILALRGNTRKCLVLDLDNTLWGGVVGDDGWYGIQLDPNHAVGEAYRFFQKYILSLKKRGVILAICSKNEENIAKEPFEKNENMLIHLNDIACFVANWEDKASNIRRIASELNIGVDSLVFFDDNAAERELVKQYVPEVHVVDVPDDPALYALQMEKESPFEWLQITKEDLERSDSYQANKNREILQNNFIDYDDYLKALEMRGSAEKVSDIEQSRFIQLINKSNQFNLRTIRYTEADIESWVTDSNVYCLCAKLSDKFSNYGLISSVILKKKGTQCFIDTWVMSCRVLKRGVEYMMFDAIIDVAQKMGCTEITAEYIKTKKNMIVSEFYDSLGFKMVREYKNDTELKKEYVFTNFKIENQYYIKKEN